MISLKRSITLLAGLFLAGPLQANENAAKFA
jgi:hypothetical protein